MTPLNEDYKKNKFDIDLEFGANYENKICDILEGGSKVEVKTERDTWRTTGNIAIEYKRDSSLSGISNTEADYWVHNLVYKDEMILSFIFPVERLRKTLKKMVKNGSARIISGGDYNKSKLVLLPIKDLISLSMELLSY
tara:strand:+ start:4161 stop:4577 length:417 start_codon:yes stop_codon:yes gene_type:complete